ncbi:Fis family transcriptional regulator [Nitzschia inconspicua]|uniref:Fis family transcriptional regulator n=1 Tax=Nitzschia inconspicua TaxID=303405 RepID=A0A9K3M572_9STRA|nr:Fis family transcriptional regulator [Nitzschia inconspicua]
MNVASPKCSRMVRWCSTGTPPSVTPPSNPIPSPTLQQLRVVAFRAAIPMVGFGLMDNFVMITAGEAIDQTFGVALGISTMAAAGFGQCVSDVAGITSGGLVDAAVSKLNLPQHGLSQEQLGLRLSRIYSTFGACIGVLTGCLLGMSVLLFMDTDRADRAKKAKELNSIFATVMDQGHSLLGADRATLFMLDEKKKELWSRVGTGIEGVIKIPADQGIVGHCYTSGKVVYVADAYKDPHFNQDVDKRTGFHTGSVLVVPVKSEEGGAILGAIQMINKRSADGSIGEFSKRDEEIVKVLANHVAAFIRVVES